MKVRRGYPRISLSPRSSVARRIVSDWFWYKLYEKTGSTVADSAGNLPTITLGGTLTNIWDNVGWLTIEPVAGNDSYSAIGNAANAAMFNMANWNNKQMILAWDFYFDGGITTTETFFGYGANTSAVSGWWMQINTSNQLTFCYRGVGGSNQSALNAAGFNAGTDPAAGANTRLALLADIRVTQNQYADIDFYCNGVSVTGLTNFDLKANAATALPGDVPAAQTQQPFVLFGRKNSTASLTSDQKIGPGGSTGRMSNIFGILIDTPDDTLPIELNTAFYENRGDLPRALIGV